MMLPGYRALLRFAPQAALIIACGFALATPAALRDMALPDILRIASGDLPAPGSGPNPIDRETAIRQLGVRPAASPEEETKITATLGKLLSDNDRRLHHVAAWALGERGKIEFVPQLFAVMESEPQLFRSFYLARLNRGGGGPPEEMLRAGLLSRVDTVRENIVDLIGLYRAATFRQEVENLLDRDPSGFVRRQAAFALARIGAVESAPVLQRAIEKDPGNDGAFYALSYLASDAQVPSLLATLNSDNAKTRAQALATLSSIKVTNPKPVIDALYRALEQTPDRPPLLAAAALARYKDQRALPFLRQIVAGRRQELNGERTCVRAIASLGSPESLALLHEMVGTGWCRGGDLEDELVKIADPSSGPVVWAA
jgi:HEAT repeat protein